MKYKANLHLFPASQVVQLEELFAVRHSVFIIGNAGTGKSEVSRGTGPYDL